MRKLKDLQSPSKFYLQVEANRLKQLASIKHNVLHNFEVCKALWKALQPEFFLRKRTNHSCCGVCCRDV